MAQRKAQSGRQYTGSVSATGTITGTTGLYDGANRAYSAGNPPPGSGGFSLSQVEVNVGGPARSGRFTITDAALAAGDQLLVAQAADLYTGKGTRYDEAEMDQIVTRGVITALGSATVYWSSNTYVKGNVRFNYRSG